jgi:hypothetical protein
MMLFNQMPIISDHLFSFLLRILLNLVFTLIVIRFIYYPKTRRKDYLFTYFLIGNVIFFMVYLLGDAQINLGFAFGMFAIFGIIRYRTNPIPTKEMTYLFVVIALSVINAVTNDKLSVFEVVLSNIIIVFITYALENIWLTNQDLSKTINFERIELIKPNRYDDLITDLRERTGLDIHKVEIGSIDFLRDVVKIRIFFYPPQNGGHIIDEDSL